MKSVTAGANERSGHSEKGWGITFCQRGQVKFRNIATAKYLKECAGFQLTEMDAKNLEMEKWHEQRNTGSEMQSGFLNNL